MTLTQVWGALLIFVLCPILGGLPLTGWLTRLVSGKRLTELGTGNVSVSAAFYHGGRVAGILAVLAEAARGIAAVLLARHYFPQDPAWEMVALIALVMGRYWMGRGAGTTNVVWGFVVSDPVVSGLTFLISGIGFTLFREKRQGRLFVLVLLPILTALRHPDEGARILAVTCLSSLIAWIYHKMPDDLDLSPTAGRLESQKMFRFFQGDRALLSLDQSLSAAKVGPKAATLAQLRIWGYPVPPGYVLLAGDDPQPLMDIVEPSPQQPLVVRSSALDEDTPTSAAAGLYTSITNVTSREELAIAIQQCFGSYNSPAAVRYRQDQQLPDRGLAVVVQQQVGGRFSGVAFSRDPIARCGDGVLIEALPGPASRVVSGQHTPEQYRVRVDVDDLPAMEDALHGEGWLLPEALTLAVDGKGTIPSRLLQQVGYLARQLELRYRGIPQDIEWTYDGQTLWLLQSRPITTLQPIWTRKIAAEVIPGAIRPLTWSINRPLTCGVWGEIFTIVLGERAAGLDFEATATLHHAYAYFNASLLGEIFRRMGLPPESLEFLTRGAAFSKPPLHSTLRNLPGLLRLLGRELALDTDFERDLQTIFNANLGVFTAISRDQLSAVELLDRIEDVLALLRRATYYNILGPLSLALRQALFKVPEASLNARQNPEVAALEDLQGIARDTRLLLSKAELAAISNASSLMAALAEHTDGQTILARLTAFIEKYGYLSAVGTDIAVPTWHENPSPVRELLAQYVLTPLKITEEPPPPATGWKAEMVQRRLDLKGRINRLYNRLLAELRWTILSLASHWVKSGGLEQPNDIFFLTYAEIRAIANAAPDALTPTSLQERIQVRQQQYASDRQVTTVPPLVFGNQPPVLDWGILAHPPASVAQILSGIGASEGIVEGTIKVIRTFQSLELAEEEAMILVVPYTDAGWAPLLARARGLITEVGGRLSHGAIVAREYRIPAVMDVEQATERLHDGQRVRLDGAKGTIEILE